MRTEQPWSPPELGKLAAREYRPKAPSFKPALAHCARSLHAIVRRAASEPLAH